ncbi:hypothetical protein JCM8097_000600 [Rhodosporidiobolus ruineniae]
MSSAQQEAFKFTFHLDQLTLEPPKVDRLSPLPPELLRRIFQLAYVDGGYVRAPLSRSLAPFHNELVYNSVNLDCYRCLKRFTRSILANPENGKLVKVLRFGSKEIGEHEDGPKPPTRKLLLKLFAATPNIGGLFFRGDTPLIPLILEPDFAKTHFRNLAILSIHASFLHVQHPFDPSHYMALEHYPSLAVLELHIDRLPANPVLPIPHSPSLKSTQHFQSLNVLRLWSTDLDATSAQAMLSSCRRLTHLTLSDGSGKVNLFDLANHLPNPSLLTHATLHRFKVEEGGAQPVDDPLPFLRRTLSLESLGLVGCVNFSPAVFTFLHTLTSLHTLDIGPHTPLDPALLLSFLNPSRRHPSLRTLKLSNVFALRGVKTNPQDLTDVWLEEATMQPRLPPGWQVPVWGDWNEGLVEQVRAAAEKMGIEVEGTTFEAAEIQEEFLAELDKIEGFLEVMAEQQAFAWEARMMAEDEWETEDEDE